MTPEERKERRRETVRKSNLKRKAAKKAWARANADKTRKRQREAYYANREKYLARSAAWRAANKEKRREVVRASNSKRSLERQEWDQLNKFGIVIKKESCAVCGTRDGGPMGLVIHHEDGCNGRNDLPVNNDPGNLVVLCRSCHVKVHSRWGLKRLKEVV